MQSESGRLDKTTLVASPLPTQSIVTVLNGKPLDACTITHGKNQCVYIYSSLKLPHNRKTECWF